MRYAKNQVSFCAHNARRSLRSAVIVLCAIGALCAFAPGGVVSAEEVLMQQRITFDDGKIEFRSDFAGGRLSDCVRIGDEYCALIRPENTPVNDSAWYAFQVRSERPQSIRVKLMYENGMHRYIPRTSLDGVEWRRLAAEKYHGGRRDALLTLDVGPQPLWVAAHELITTSHMLDWMSALAERPDVRTSEIGKSVQKRPIYKLDVGSEEISDSIFIMARQHPPEVTGAIGMMNFVETICGDTELAREFRAVFRVVVVPLANPDGVELGNWRHNAQGVDLNRDWDAFEQPETRAVRDELLELDRAGRVHLFVDFHSTFQNLFYTHFDDPKVTPFGFTWKWLANIEQRFPKEDVYRHICRKDRSTARNWAYRTLGAPAISYELGDRATRSHIARISQGSAEEMMRLMLAKAEWHEQRLLAAETRPASSGGE